MSINSVEEYLTDEELENYNGFFSHISSKAKSFKRKAKIALGKHNSVKVDDAGTYVWERTFSIPGKHNSPDYWNWQLHVNKDGMSLFVVDKHRLPDGAVKRAGPAAVDDFITVWNTSIEKTNNMKTEVSTRSTVTEMKGKK